MTSVTNLSKVDGVVLNTWFIPTTFNALELDNSFVFWAGNEMELYLDTTNNLLKVKYFNRMQRSFGINVKIVNNKIYMYRNQQGQYYSKEGTVGFKMPKVNDDLLMNGVTYSITGVTISPGDIEITINNQSTFIGSFRPSVSYINRDGNPPLYTDSTGNYFSKNYRSKNVADLYIDGADIRSVAGRYI